MSFETSFNLDSILKEPKNKPNKHDLNSVEKKSNWLHKIYTPLVLLYLKLILTFWVIFISSYFIFEILELLNKNFEAKNGLDNSVLITLLTTTTINIIGMPYILIKSIFKKELSEF